MRRKTIFYAITILSLAAGLVWAADLNGKWVGQIREKGGEPREISFGFKVTGAKLDGTVAGALKGPILNGKVKGDEISFTLSIGTEGAKRILIFNGRVINGEIQFKVHREGGEGGGVEFTVKREAN